MSHIPSLTEFTTITEAYFTSSCIYRNDIDCVKINSNKKPSIIFPFQNKYTKAILQKKKHQTKQTFYLHGYNMWWFSSIYYNFIFLRPHSNGGFHQFPTWFRFYLKHLLLGKMYRTFFALYNHIFCGMGWYGLVRSVQ